MIPHVMTTIISSSIIDWSGPLFKIKFSQKFLGVLKETSNAEILEDDSPFRCHLSLSSKGPFRILRIVLFKIYAFDISKSPKDPIKSKWFVCPHLENIELSSKLQMGFCDMTFIDVLCCSLW